MTKITNRTPHVISIKYDDRVEILEPAGKPVRVKSRLGKPVWSENGLTVHSSSTNIGLQHLPPPEPDTLVVVSQIAALVAARLHPERTDVVFPATSSYHGAERDGRGVLTISRLIRAS
jgi:hypothetical protein